MVPPLCYKHNDIHSELINALHFWAALKNRFLPSLPAARGDSEAQGPAPPQSLRLRSWEGKQGWA